jgi:hypothetical protein
MDRTFANHAQLFDDLLSVLERHREEPGVAEAFEDLKAAKINYAQGSTDQLVTCLVLAANNLATHSPSPALVDELKAAMTQFVAKKLETGSRLSDLARQYEAGGGKLLSYEEILREVDERRGVSR